MNNIICLHGYGSNSNTLKRIMAKHIEKLQNYNLIFVDGPHKVGENNCWWYYEIKFGEQLDWNTIIHEQTFGLEYSIEYIKPLIQDINTIAVLGFSQGAAFANILNHYFNIPKIILCSGFLINGYQNKSTNPSLHIFGESDVIIPQELSRELADTYEYPEILIHEKGHIFPNNSKTKNKLLDFLNK